MIDVKVFICLSIILIRTNNKLTKNTPTYRRIVSFISHNIRGVDPIDYKKIIVSNSNTTMGSTNGKVVGQSTDKTVDLTEDLALVVNFKRYSNKNLKRYMEAKIKHKELKAIRVMRTSVSDKEAHLNLEPISIKIPHFGSMDMKLINTLPCGEIDVNELGKLGVYSVLGRPFSFTSRNIIPFTELNHYYNNIITTLSRQINKELLPITENISELHGTCMDPKTIPIQGPFIQILEYDPEEKEYYFDFMHLKNIEHRDNLKKMPLKAFYVPNKHRTLDLIRVEALENDKTIVMHPPFSMDIHRHINSMLASQNTLTYHVIITHLEVAQSFAYCVRKFLSRDNPLKEYLLHFTNGTLRVNNIFIPVLLAKNGPAHSAFPYTRKGFNDFFEDVVTNFKTNPSKYRRLLDPTNDKTYLQLKSDNVNTVTQDDACEIYKILAKNVDDMLLYIKNLKDNQIKKYSVDDLSRFDHEMLTLEKEFKQNCRLILPDDSFKDMLVFALYVGTVTHEIVGNLISDYFINGTYITGTIVDSSKIINSANQITGLSENSYYNAMNLLTASDIKGNMLMDIDYIENLDIKHILSKMCKNLEAYEEIIKSQNITSAMYRLYPSRLEAGVQV